jgi:hypothetical protein
MVTVPAKPIDFSAKFFQFSFSGLSAFALQDTTVIVHPILDCPPFLFSEEPIKLPVRSRHDCGTANTQIHAYDQAVWFKRLALAFKNDVQEQTIFLVPTKFTSTNFPFFEPVKIFGQDKLGFLSSRDGCNGCPTFFKIDCHGPLTIVTNGLSKRLGTFKSFRFEFCGIVSDFGIVLDLFGFDRGKGFMGFGDHGTNKLCWKLGEDAFVFIPHEMDGDHVGGLAEGLFGGSVEGVGVLFDCLFNSQRSFRRHRELESKSHIHAHLILQEDGRFLFKSRKNLKYFLEEGDATNSSTG